MNKKTDFTKQAEENILHQINTFEFIYRVLDAMSQFGNAYLKGHRDDERERFFRGLQMMRDSVNAALAERTQTAFMFSAVFAGLREKAQKQLLEVFDDDNRFAVMQFLERSGRSPSWYKSEDEEEFRKQIKEKLADTPDCS